MFWIRIIYIVITIISLSVIVYDIKDNLVGTIDNIGLCFIIFIWSIVPFLNFFLLLYFINLKLPLLKKFLLKKVYRKEEEKKKLKLDIIKRYQVFRQISIDIGYFKSQEEIDEFIDGVQVANALINNGDD